MDIDFDDEFEDFMRKAYSEVEPYSIQYRESRRIFFAGLATVYFFLMELGNLPDDQAEEGLIELKKQLDEFFKRRVVEDKD